MSVLLDTHIWLWWLTGAERLKAADRDALGGMSETARPVISAISLWEAQMLVSRKRLALTEPFEQWIRRMASPDVVNVLPLDAVVVIALHALPDSFHGDPADRLIVATARAHVLPLATYDAGVRRSRLTKLWRS